MTCGKVIRKDREMLLLCLHMELLDQRFTVMGGPTPLCSDAATKRTELQTTDSLFSPLHCTLIQLPCTA